MQRKIGVNISLWNMIKTAFVKMFLGESLFKNNPKIYYTTLLTKIIYLLFFVHNVYTSIESSKNTNKLINIIHDKLYYISKFVNYVENIFELSRDINLKCYFNDIDLAAIKSRKKTEISKRKDDLVKTVHNLELFSKIFQDMEEPTNVEFPIKSKPSSYEKITKNEEIKLKNCNIRIKKLQIEIKKLKDEINDLKVFNTFIKDKELNIDTLTSFLEELSLQEQNISYDDNILNEYKNRLKILLSKNKLLIKEKQ